MRKWIAMLLLAGMLLPLTACDKTQQETEPTVITAETTQATEPSQTVENTSTAPTTDAPVDVPMEEVTEETTAEYRLVLPLEEQVALMIAQRASWLNEDELYGFMYNFTVADMDRNGRCELYFGSCEGTGLYTFVDAWELGEDCSSLLPVEKDYAMEHSQADIIRGQATVYYEEQQDTYCYIFSDENRNGWVWQGSEKRVWCLKDGRISEEILGSYNCETDESYTTREFYLDAQEREISKEDYEQLEALRFADCRSMEAKLLWQSVDIEELDTLTDELLADLLLQSAEGFTLE